MLDTTMSLEDLARCEIHSLHIPPHLLGYHYLVYAVEQVAADPLRIKGITKDLYREIARYYHRKVSSVERNIRTAIIACWNSEGKEKLGEMAGYHLTERPSGSVFIAIVAERVAEIYREKL